MNSHAGFWGEVFVFFVVISNVSNHELKFAKRNHSSKVIFFIFRLVVLLFSNLAYSGHKCNAKFKIKNVLIYHAGRWDFDRSKNMYAPT